MIQKFQKNLCIYYTDPAHSYIWKLDFDPQKKSLKNNWHNST
jgi:hypothetical protein